MTLIPFNCSERYTLGTELELQVTDRNNPILPDKANALLTDINMVTSQQQIKCELPQAMIKLNSSVHYSVITLYNELFQLTKNARAVVRKHLCDISGGNYRPVGYWQKQVVNDLPYQQYIANSYDDITRVARVFGQHIHIGVRDGNEAIYLCHALLPYLPHLVALSASSPWLNGVSSRFTDSHFTGQNTFVNCELPASVHSWNAFSVFYNELIHARIIKNIKDIYWYVRPRPELGTVEIRICDMPLTVYHAAMLVGYCKMLVHYLLNRRQHIFRKYHVVEKHNIFNAYCKGLQASYNNVLTRQRQPLSEHILQVLKLLSGFLRGDDELVVLQYVENYVIKSVTNSEQIRRMIKHTMNLDIVMEQMRRMLLSTPAESPLLEYREKSNYGTGII